MPLQEWYHAFDPNNHATHKNTALSCVLVIWKNRSGSMTSEKSELVKKIPNSEKIEWHFVEFGDVREEYKIRDFIEKEILDAKYKPTDVVLDFPHETIGYWTKKKRRFCIELDKSGHFIQNMVQYGILDQVQDQEPHSSEIAFLPLNDIWHKSAGGAYLMSNVPTTGKGWTDELEKLILNR